MTHWEYMAFEMPLAMHPEEYLVKVNALGREGWEVYHMAGWCFLRRKIAE